MLVLAEYLAEYVTHCQKSGERNLIETVKGERYSGVIVEKTVQASVKSLICQANSSDASGRRRSD